MLWHSLQLWASSPLTRSDVLLPCSVGQCRAARKGDRLQSIGIGEPRLRSRPQIDPSKDVRVCPRTPAQLLSQILPGDTVGRELHCERPYVPLDGTVKLELAGESGSVESLYRGHRFPPEMER